MESLENLKILWELNTPLGWLQHGASGLAVEHGGAGTEGAAGVEQAGGLPRRWGVEPAEGGVCCIPGGADCIGVPG